MKRLPTVWLALFAGLFALGAFWPLPGGALLGQAAAPAEAPATGFHYFSFMSDNAFSNTERVLLFVVLAVAFAGLAYRITDTADHFESVYLSSLNGLKTSPPSPPGQVFAAYVRRPGGASQRSPRSR